MTGILAGCRVLVVEDSPLIAADAEDMLREFGCAVVGPTGSLAVAIELAEKEALDAAVIDVNIRGWKVFPVAEILAARDVPFLLASGYADWTMPDRLNHRPRLLKPYNKEDLRRELTSLLQGPEEGEE